MISKAGYFDITYEVDEVGSRYGKYVWSDDYEDLYDAYVELLDSYDRLKAEVDED